jgi:HEAT repeat protein
MVSFNSMKWFFGRRDPKAKLQTILNEWHLFETVDLNRPELADKLRDFAARLLEQFNEAKSVISTSAEKDPVAAVDFLFDVLAGLPAPPENPAPLPDAPDFTWENAETGLGPVARVVNRIRITFQAELVGDYERRLTEARRRSCPPDELTRLQHELQSEVKLIDQEFRNDLKNMLLLYQLYDHCLDTLARINSPAAEQELIKRLGAPQPQDRLFALKALTRRQFQPRTAEQALNYLIARAKLLDGESERRQAEKELTQLIEGTESYDELVNLIEPRLAEEGLVKLQARTIEQLARRAPDQARSRYQEIISGSDEPPELKTAVVRATAEIILPHNPEAGVSLLVAALDDLETEVRVAAARALARLPQNTTEPARTAALERLLFALRDGDLEVRAAAARAINPETYPGAGARIARLLVSETNPNAREYAAVTLELNFPAAPETTAALIQALNDDDAAVRKAAAQALTAQRAIPTEPRTRLQFLCAKQDWSALASAGKAALECLLPRLRDLKTEIRLEVARLLGKIRAREAVRDLCIALSDSSQDVRKAAARALAEIGDPAAVPALKTAISREGFREVREEMERAVRKLS